MKGCDRIDNYDMRHGCKYRQHGMEMLSSSSSSSSSRHSRFPLFFSMGSESRIFWFCLVLFDSFAHTTVGRSRTTVLGSGVVLLLAAAAPVSFSSPSFDEGGDETADWVALLPPPATIGTPVVVMTPGGIALSSFRSEPPPMPPVGFPKISK
mmetsp:Transcript_29360/g.62965  ORF Transcript_29360/g.62965 Transcript_29360/m.62965 type:complete len:152 (-) Transcript_29360:1454-1909(-)